MENSSKESKSSLSMDDIFLTLWINKKSIMLITSIFSIVGLIISLFLTPWYTATARIMPTDEQNSNIMSQYSKLANLAGISMPSMQMSKYYFYPDIIKSNFMIDKILATSFKTSKNKNEVLLYEFWEVEVDSTLKNWDIKLKEESRKKIRKQYIYLEFDRLTDILTLEITVPEDPVLAAEIANFILDELDKYNKIFRKYKTREYRIFVEEQYFKIKSDLNNLMTDLEVFLEQNKDIKTPKKQMMLEKIKTELEVQKVIYAEIRKQLEIAKIEEIKETALVDILDRAQVPYRKSRPSRAIFVIIMFIFGLTFSFFYVMVKNYLRILTVKYKKFNANG